VIPEVTLGKRCARLDLRAAADREGFRRLLGEADVLIHGYRPGALDALGFDSAARRDLAPGLVDISLDAYGWSGPWAARRGFDSLVQMSTGIAEAGMRWRKADHPVPLPVQALDHATGYLMAAAAIRGLTRRLTDGAATVARLSLARTASVLIAARANPGENPLAPEALDDLASETEETDWGAARRLRPPLVIAETPLRWDRPARMLGTSPPDWS
jgi:crotonobetainyl-CoA:carnitine CoA-transferase CaiB-like acyl-CoA transferase